MFNIFRSPLVAIGLLIIGTLAVYGGHKNSVEITALLDHGKTAEAEITKLEWKENKSNHSDDKEYTAHIRFTTADGRETKVDMSITSELGRALRNQTRSTVMAIRYLPESPTVLRRIEALDPSDDQSVAGRYMLVAGIILLAIRYFINR